MSYPITALILLRNIEELALYKQLAERVPHAICFVFLRIFVVLAILAFSVGIPHFALVTAFAGSFSFCIVLVFPGLFHLCLKYKRLSKLQVLGDVVLITLGIVFTLFGMITTVMSLALKKM